MKTYKPGASSVTVGGVPVKGITSLSFGEPIIGTRPPARSFATVADLEAAGLGLDRIGAVLGIGRNPFSRAGIADTAVSIGETMGLRITATAAPPDPPDGRALVTVRCEARPLRNREMREIREALQQRAPIGARVVVRDRASLDAKRDRALAPLLDPPQRATATAIRARLERSMRGPRLPLP